MRTWNPFEEIEALRRDLTRVFEGARTSPAAFRSAFLPARAARAYPLVNVSEDKENVYVEALAPGVDPETLEATVLRDRLTLAGEKKPLDGAAPERVHRSERAAGRFTRTLELPVEVDDSRTLAEYAGGILRLTLPKAENARPRRIAVNVA